MVCSRLGGAWNDSFCSRVLAAIHATGFFVSYVWDIEQNHGPTTLRHTDHTNASIQIEGRSELPNHDIPYRQMSCRNHIWPVENPLKYHKETFYYCAGAQRRAWPKAGEPHTTPCRYPKAQAVYQFQIPTSFSGFGTDTETTQSLPWASAAWQIIPV